MSEPEFNPIVQAAMLEAVENQLRDEDPPETKQTYERLLREGFSSEESKKLIGAAILIEMNEMVRRNEKFKLERFVAELERLPDIFGDE